MKVFFAAAAATIAGTVVGALDNPCIGAPGLPTLTAEKCNTTDPFQQWAFANGNVVRKGDPTQCVSVSNYGTSDETPLVVAPCHPGDKTPGHNNQAFA